MVESNIEAVSPGWDLAKTRAFHERLLNADDGIKMAFALNWRLPHTLFNVAWLIWSQERDQITAQSIDWHAIHRTRNLGAWENGNPVIVQG